VKLGPREIRNASQFFEAMSPEVRDRAIKCFMEFAYHYATATAMGYDKDGRRLKWQMTGEMQDSIRDAALDAFLGAEATDALKTSPGES